MNIPHNIGWKCQLFNNRPELKNGDVIVTDAPFPRMLLKTAKPVEFVYQDGVFYQNFRRQDDTATTGIVTFSRPLTYLEVYSPNMLCS